MVYVISEPKNKDLWSVNKVDFLKENDFFFNYENVTFNRVTRE